MCREWQHRELALMADLLLGDAHISLTKWRRYRSGTGSWGLRIVSRETDRHVRPGNARAPSPVLDDVSGLL